MVGAALHVWTWLSSKIGQAIGIYLRRRSEDRKAAILDRVRGEDSIYRGKERGSPKSDDEDWEKVEQHLAGSATPEGKAEDEWDGIVGFFHPFWWVSSFSTIWGVDIECIIVMPVEVVKESSGLRSKLRKDAGLRLYVLYIQVIMMPQRIPFSSVSR